ncbi:nitroreductase/quinone reductase family protein [Microbacterium halotolerans]|uniref:nitroreductase/quinone reductase family protein n=1 Tax=Microbacterium halotolerans TaxID=246613 RepID=UPI000E6AE1AB|nr:nitroreductase/quinone reductase family protein [Microbacterium halotolerans]
MAREPFVPPRFVIKTAWGIHRWLARRGTGRGLWKPGQRNAWGALALTTTGRSSGEPRTAIIAYLPDGADRVHALAMNGWMEGHPGWWLNLKADPRASALFADGDRRAVSATAAEGDERERLWAVWEENEPGLNDLASRRRTPTEIVVLELAD